MNPAWQVKAGGQRVRTLESLQALLLAQRGIDAAEEGEFFDPSFEISVHDPRQLHDIDKAVDRIFVAVEKGERILVYGDYDADGISATAVLVTVLQDLGANVTPYLPHRMDEGYGLNKTALTRLLPEFDLLVSADCGVSNREEIAWLAKKKKDTIVVDHHELPGKLPPAEAIVHPRLGNYLFGHLSGAGVAWKLAQALAVDRRSTVKDGEDYAKWLLDLAVLGTIGDVVPLLGENRAIARFGLQVLRRTKREGLRALLAVCDIGAGGIASEDLAFRLVPRLNAAGRMDHPQPALDLLLTGDERRARELVKQLNSFNQARQSLTRKVMREAEATIDPTLPFVFAANVAWPAGIVGLAAGKLARAYAKPAIVVGGNGEHGVGSARAPEGANVLQLLRSSEKQLMKLGGHERAAGFSVAEGKIEELLEALTATTPGESVSATPGVDADATIDTALINWDLHELVEKFEPFGEGNSKPTFVAKALPVLDMRPVGKKEDHVKLVFQGTSEPLEAIGFGMADKISFEDDMVDAAFQIEANEFRGRRTLQMNLKDIRKA